MFMDTDEIEQELGAMQISDSFFPTGAFATSNGLEYLFTQKDIRRKADLIEMIRVSIVQQMGPTDCIALAYALENSNRGNLDGVIQADNTVFATKPVKEIRDASTRSGIQMIRCVAGFVSHNKILSSYQDSILEKRAHGILPVAFAVCCSALGIKKEKGMAMLLYGFSVAVVGAALRLGLIQHFDGQKIIHEIKPVIAKAVKDNSDRSLLEMWQFAPQMDIIQMSHEKMDSKMFIT